MESTVSNLLVEPDVQAIVLNHRNINARRAAEAENHRFANQLTRAKLETEEFARTVAHGLREPLRTVSALTSVLMQSVEMQSGQREIAEMIVDGVARMTTLVEDLLVFATAGMDEQPQPVDLAAAAAEATRNLDQVLRESGARILIGKLPKAYGNAGQLTRLFQNLIDNAVRHCGGKRPRIEVFAELQWPDWVISVKDHGAGIAPPDQIRVFQPFVRLSSRDVPGTGLGLAVCKEIVENMGGVIWVESNLGAGSTFSFTIAAGEPNPAKLRDP